MKIRTLLSLLPVAAVACSDGQPVDIGHTEAQLSDYAAHWDGYAEAHTFAAGNTDRVRLNLDANGVGTVEVGAGSLPAPNAEIGYPVDLSNTFRDGFQYAVQGARIEAGRIRFGVNSLEVFDAWCALQTPVQLGEDAYGCLPNWAARSYDGGERCELINGEVTMPVDCQKLMLCHAGVGVCACTASGCAAASYGEPATLLGYDVLIDAAIDATGTSLVGTLRYNEQRITIRLNK